MVEGYLMEYEQTVGHRRVIYGLIEVIMEMNGMDIPNKDLCIKEKLKRILIYHDSLSLDTCEHCDQYEDCTGCMFGDKTNE